MKGVGEASYAMVQQNQNSLCCSKRCSTVEYTYSVHTNKHKYELENNKKGKPKRRLKDLFSEVQDHTTVIPTSPLRKLELLTRPTPSRVSFNHFSQSTSFAYFLTEVKRIFTNFFKAHHKLREL
jgi:hypothetical protein